MLISTMVAMVEALLDNPCLYLHVELCECFLVQRNYDPSLHPMETAREYTQALNATKLERVFAKPYVGCLDGHSDGVHTMAKHPSRLSMLASGAYDGEVCCSKYNSKTSNDTFLHVIFNLEKRW